MISVIVPVYNCKDYLDECVKSILGQTYKEFELILVDDGTPDCSGQMCDEYEKQDARIRVLHKENEGAAYARRDGAYLAANDYVCFVDSDDWIEPNMLEALADSIDKYHPDIVSYGMSFGDYPNVDKYPAGFYEGAQLEEMKVEGLYKPELDDEAIVASPCTKLYKKELLLPYLEKLKPNLRCWEDINYAYAPIFDAKSLVILPDIFYRYRVNEASVSKAYNWSELERTIYSLEGAEAVYGAQSSKMLAGFYCISLRILWGCFERYYIYSQNEAESSKIEGYATSLKESSLVERAFEVAKKMDIPEDRIEFFENVRALSEEDFIQYYRKKKAAQERQLAVRGALGKIYRKIFK